MIKKISLFLFLLYLVTPIFTITPVTDVETKVTEIKIESVKSSFYNQNTHKFDYIELTKGYTYGIYDPLKSRYEDINFSNIQGDFNLLLSLENNFSSHPLDQPNSSYTSFIHSDNNSSIQEVNFNGFIKKIRTLDNNDAIEVVLDETREHYFGMSNVSLIINNKKSIPLLYLALANNWKIKINGAFTSNNSKYIRFKPTYPMINNRTINLGNSFKRNGSLYYKDYIKFASISKDGSNYRIQITETALDHTEFDRINNLNYGTKYLQVLYYHLEWVYTNDDFRVTSVEAPYTE